MTLLNCILCNSWSPSFFSIYILLLYKKKTWTCIRGSRCLMVPSVFFFGGIPIFVRDPYHVERGTHYICFVWKGAVSTHRVTIFFNRVQLYTGIESFVRPWDRKMFLSHPKRKDSFFEKRRKCFIFTGKKNLSQGNMFFWCTMMSRFGLENFQVDHKLIKGPVKKRNLRWANRIKFLSSGMNEIAHSSVWANYTHTTVRND